MKKLTSILVAGFFALVAGALPAWAASLDGTWTGNGFVSPSEGQRENVRCRITYRRVTPKVYSVIAVCASPSNKVRQTGELLKVSETRYVGDFYNPDFDVSGRVRVVVSGSRQTVTFFGGAGSGRLTLYKR